MGLNRSTEDNFWDEVSHPEIPIKRIVIFYRNKNIEINYQPFKLHLSISPYHYERAREALQPLLDQATLDKVITSYKSINEKVDFFKEKDQRAIHLPFSLYLHEEFNADNMQKVVALCKQIEEALRLIPGGEKKYLFKCDLPVSTHITFRQTAIKKEEYLPADRENENALAEAGLASEQFKTLQRGMQQRVVRIHQADEKKDAVSAQLLGGKSIFSGTGIAVSVAPSEEQKQKPKVVKFWKG